MRDGNRGRILAMTIGNFLAFLVFGAVDILKGSTLFAVLDETGFSYSTGGLVVMASYFGFFVSTLAAGVVAEIGGKKTIIVVASLCFLAGMGGYSSARGLPMFLLTSFLIGLGCGSTEVGSNYIIVDVQPKNPGLYLNLLAASFGLGSMLGPLYSGRLFKAGFTWREIYWFALLAPAVLLVVFLAAPYPRLDRPPPERPSIRAMAKNAFSGWMLWFYLLAFAYVAAETAIGHWIVEYLRVVRNIPADAGSNWLSLFFACIMIGRFVGGFCVGKIGYLRSMAAATALAMAAVLAGVYGPDGLAPFLPLSGLFFSIILPTATALLSSLVPKKLGSVLGVLFCFVGLGGMAGPWLAGVVNDVLGLKAGLSVSMLFLLALAGSLVKIRAHLGRGKA